MRRLVYWTGYGLLSILGSLLLSWWLLAQLNFLYPLWYQVLAIDRHIAVYAPQNRHRAHFERTDRAEHLRLFASLNKAIHDQARGLETLRYHDPAGRPLGLLLTDPERRHLQDVALVVQRALPIGWAALGLWVLWSVVLYRRRARPPPLRRFMGGTLLGLVGLGVVVALVGPVKLFYVWHEWVFPPENPWFFYYQDSLMTTLLKAPDLFMAIGAAWLLMAWGLALGLWALARAVIEPAVERVARAATPAGHRPGRGKTPRRRRR